MKKNKYKEWGLDAPIMVWDGNDDEEGEETCGHFAGTTMSGKPLTWDRGQTSWTTSNGLTIPWEHACLKAEWEANS